MSAETMTETAPTDSIASRIERRREADRLANWQSLADCLRNKGKRSADEVAAKLADIADRLEIPIEEIDSLKRIIVEYDHLDDIDDQAAAAAGALEVASGALGDFDSETDAIIAPLRAALAAAEQERAQGRGPLAQAAEQAKVQAERTQKRQGRRQDLACAHPDLLNTHEVKRATDEAIADASSAKQAIEDQKRRADVAVATMHGWHLSDWLADPARSRIVDSMARRGTYSRHDVDPTFEGSKAELSPTVIDDTIAGEIKARRQHLLIELAEGRISKAEAGPLVVQIAEHRGDIPKKSTGFSIGGGQ